ncbi:MAG TPA: class II aldolase/adducin family protein, partial [Burkholderiales bacterium]|nr:class II aldolase/adducin family protein [Burkholderiales bacterium]
MKQDFIERVNREMAQDLPALKGTAPELLAACCRILAAEGHESGLAGQVSARANGPDASTRHLWTLEFGYGFDEATTNRMVLVDDDLKPLSGGRPNPGVRFHVWIY